MNTGSQKEHSAGASGERSASGYREQVGPGPRVRTDVVEVYVFKRLRRGQRPESHVFVTSDAPRMSGEVHAGVGDDESIWFLQLCRNRPPLKGTFHPVLGHIELKAGAERGCERASDAAQRELAEEIGLDLRDACVRGFWALERVWPYYIEAIDCVVMSPRFVAEVDAQWEPRLNHEHSAYRWVHEADVSEAFLWPSQRASAKEVTDSITHGKSIESAFLRIDERTK